MTFKTNTAAAQEPATNARWKAKGFINMYLPTQNGGKRKLGAIPLRNDKPNEAQLAEWLSEDPSRVAQVLSKLQMDYQEATQAEGTGFALGE